MATILLFTIAGALRTRLGKLKFAWLLLWTGNVLGEAGSRVLESAKGQNP